ncbi:MAG: transcriptional activator RfaH [Alphaproteobacteria bacterium]|nr:transcriptional activator RfaH [Alphaproteobacteria bacterium]
MERWFVVHTKPHAEPVAERHLRRQGFVPYLPQIRREVRHAGRTRSVLRPLFPGYLFVRLDTGAGRWQAIRSTVGVSALLGGTAGPRPVTDAVVEHIQSHEDADGLIALKTPVPFEVGQMVTIGQGAFQDIVGTCVGLDDAGRVAVLLQVLGRQVRVCLPQEWIAA